MDLRHLVQLQSSPYLEQCNDRDLSGSTFAWALDGERTVGANDNDHTVCASLSVLSFTSYLHGRIQEVDFG